MISIFARATVRPRLVHLALLALVAVSGIGLVSAAAEWYLRRIVPIDWTQEHRVPHPVRGWALEPNASYTTYVPEPIYVRYNSRGWRDHEASGSSSSARGIVVLGDSFMEAYTVDLAEAFSSQLARLAMDSEYPVDVLNFGVGGYGTLQEYLTFLEIADESAPRLVLLGFTLGNDVYNNDVALQGTAPVARRPFLDPDAGDTWRLLPIDFEGATRAYEAERARRSQWPLRDARRSVLLRLAGRVVGRVRNVWSNPPADEGVARNAIDRGDLVRFGVHFCQEPPAITRAWTLTSRILVYLRDAVTARGASIAVLTVPSIEEVDPDAQRIALSTASDASKVCLGEAPGYRRLIELLAQLDIPVVDLLPTFRTAMSEGQAGLFRREKHWGPTGHALAAEHVLTAITEGNWLAPDATRPEGR